MNTLVLYALVSRHNELVWLSQQALLDLRCSNLLALPAPRLTMHAEVGGSALHISRRRRNNGCGDRLRLKVFETLLSMCHNLDKDKLQSQRDRSSVLSRRDEATTSVANQNPCNN